jgi:DNA polymerase-3 subunit gamma/tau
MAAEQLRAASPKALFSPRKIAPMSYLVLARKYRPRNFSEMVGQEHVVQALTNALSQQRLHHAYLFTGTRGVGKTTVSRILAKSLNCTGPHGEGSITATPCGVCPACTEIEAGRFVDYTELDAASNRGVDEVQQLLEQAVYKPVQGRFKVFMIDEVHMLTNTAFNAMLKTLEEPPEYLKFVLATTDPQKVPVTVLSRCLQFNLRPMAPETVMAQLAHVLAAEQVPAEPQALRLLARAARGSMRDALSLTDQAIAFGSGQVHEATVRQMLGSVDRGVVFSLIGALAAGDGKTVVDLSDQLRAAGLSAATTLEDMASVLQRMAVLQAAPGLPADDTDPDAPDIARLAAQLPADETQLLYSLCIHGRAELGLAPDEYAGLTMALLRLLPFKQASVAAEKKTLNPAETSSVPPAQPAVQALPVRQPSTLAKGELHQAPAPAEQKSLATDMVAVAVREATDEPAPPCAAPKSEPPPAYATDEGDFWHALVQNLVAREAITALVRELALQAQLLARDGDQWTLRIENESLANIGVRDRLQSALTEAGHAARLRIEVGPVTDSPSRRNAIAAARRLKAAEALLLADPFVQEMMHDFEGKIVPGSIKPL